MRHQKSFLLTGVNPDFGELSRQPFERGVRKLGAELHRAQLRIHCGAREIEPAILDRDASRATACVVEQRDLHAFLRAADAFEVRHGKREANPDRIHLRECSEQTGFGVRRDEAAFGAQRTPGNAADRRFDVRIGKIELSLGEPRLRALDCCGGLLERRKCVVIFALADRFARGERFQAPGFALGLLLACALLRERGVRLCDGNLVRRAVDHEQHGARGHGRAFGVQALLDNSGDARADLHLARAFRLAYGLEHDRQALRLDTLDGDRHRGRRAARVAFGGGARFLFAAGKKEYNKARAQQLARTRAATVRTFFGKRAEVHTESGTGMWTQEGAIISNPGCYRCAPLRQCDWCRVRLRTDCRMVRKRTLDRN